MSPSYRKEMCITGNILHYKRRNSTESLFLWLICFVFFFFCYIQNFLFNIEVKTVEIEMKMFLQQNFLRFDLTHLTVKSLRKSLLL